MSKEIKIAIAGLGTIGGGVYKILVNEIKQINKRCKNPLKLIAVSNLTKPDFYQDCDAKFYNNCLDLVNDDEVDVIIELIGGSDGISYKLAKAALEAKKHYITANKALIAKHGNELSKIAEMNEVYLNFEAAVAGGIPAIKNLREGLSANKIEKIIAILNGTCNFILTKMEKENLPFDEVLKEAQELGYAEADPTFDIDGIDTAHKLVILSAIAQNNKIDFDNISIEGIAKITIDDINFAKEFGYKIKLVGIFEDLNNGQIMQNTYPALVPAGSHIAPIDDSYNALLIKGNNSDWNLSVGRGAGEFPTASAVIADAIDIANDRYTHPLGAKNSDLGVSNITHLSSRVGKYYLRFIADNNPDFIKSQFKDDIIENFTVKEDGDKIIYGVFTKSIAEKEILSLKEKFVNDNNFIFIRIENI
ncbi:MAG: homoserine dehydrogenase [Rickettsiales bacterium]|jgi:homoserine dehydrogenase